jgi:hypothetical protein
MTGFLSLTLIVPISQHTLGFLNNESDTGGYAKERIALLVQSLHIAFQGGCSNKVSWLRCPNCFHFVVSHWSESLHCSEAVSRGILSLKVLLWLDFQTTKFQNVSTLILLNTFTPTQSATFQSDPAEKYRRDLHDPKLGVKAPATRPHSYGLQEE